MKLIHLQQNPTTTGREKAMQLLDLLPSRGPYAFDALYRALVRHGLNDAANLLKVPRQHHEQPVALPLQQVVLSDEDELPDSESFCF